MRRRRRLDFEEVGGAAGAGEHGARAATAFAAEGSGPAGGENVVGAGVVVVIVVGLGEGLEGGKSEAEALTGGG